MQTIPLTEAMIAGAVSIEHGDGWLQPWRLPHEQRELFCSPDDILLTRAQDTAGVRLRLKTGSSRFQLQLEPAEIDRVFDLTIESELQASLTLAAGEDTLPVTLPAAAGTCELWLPQRSGPVRLRALQSADDVAITDAPLQQPRWIVYGSSITHCAAAHSPARTWPATAARSLGWHLTCLGFGGNCQLEPMCARMIRDLPAEFIALKLGINVMGAASLGPRTFKAAVIGLIQIIRERHPTTPIAVISPIISPPRETTPNVVGLSLAKMREEIVDAVARIRRTCDDRHLHYFDGHLLFGPALVDSYLPDDLHPDGDGCEIMGQNFVTQVAPTLLGS